MMVSRMIRCRLPALLVVCGILLGACARSSAVANAPTPTLAPPRVTPAAIAAKLAPTATLAEAANQLAQALGVSPDNVRVRMPPQGCLSCGQTTDQAAGSLAGLAVAEAAQQVQTGAQLWLFVQQLSCNYHFDGQRFTPHGCQLAPL
jgi:hypothetical protein